MRLFHYTCDHGRRGIGRRGFIIPQPQLFGGRLVWLTDMEVPDRFTLGLTSDILSCDRLRFRYTTDDVCEPWNEWAWRQKIPVHVRYRLEIDRDPSHWFVSECSVWALLDRAYSERTA